MKLISIVAGVVVAFVLAFYIFDLNHIGINDVGVAYNSWNGELTTQTNAGWYVTSPFVEVVRLSTLPQKIVLPTMANVIDMKIVKLRKEKVVDFVKLQGFSYNLNPWLDNILIGYVFSGQKYDFIEIVQDSGSVTNN